MQGFVFTPFLIFSYAALFILAGAGGWTERRVAALLLAVLALTRFIETWTIDGFRWAVALSSLAVFIILLWMALTRDRWWLVFAAGCQLVALATHIVALLRIDTLEWTMVSIRWFSWFFMMAIVLFGAWEGRVLSRIARQGRPAT